MLDTKLEKIWQEKRESSDKKVQDFCNPVAPGVFKCSGANHSLYLGFSLGIRDSYINDFFDDIFPKEYPELRYKTPYGVADNYEQILDYAYPWIALSRHSFVIAFNEVHRKEQLLDGGWRWEKWGEYIGSQEQTSDYLYHEKHIEKIICFSILKVDI